jgi:hypothetical protein
LYLSCVDRCFCTGYIYEAEKSTIEAYWWYVECIRWDGRYMYIKLSHERGTGGRAVLINVDGTIYLNAVIFSPAVEYVIVRFQEPWAEGNHLDQRLWRRVLRSVCLPLGMEKYHL